MKNLFSILLFSFTLFAFAEKSIPVDKEIEVSPKFKISFPYFILSDPIENSSYDQQNTQKVEFRTTGKQDDKNFSRLKLFNWRLFHPMAITNCDSLLDKLEAEGEFFLGHVRETRIGVNVQRMLCKRLLETVEVLHQIQTYLGEKGAHFGIDFKFFNSYQIDFHFPIDRN